MIATDSERLSEGYKIKGAVDPRLNPADFGLWLRFCCRKRKTDNIPRLWTEFITLEDETLQVCIMQFGVRDRTGDLYNLYGKLRNAKDVHEDSEEYWFKGWYNFETQKGEFKICAESPIEGFETETIDTDSI